MHLAHLRHGHVMVYGVHLHVACVGLAGGNGGDVSGGHLRIHLVVDGGICMQLCLGHS